jgi:hypothetical protein
MGWRRMLFGFACCGLLTLSVVGSAGPALARPAASWGENGLFVVETTGGEYSELLLSLDPDPEHGFPAHVAIAVPAGFELYADRPPAELVGHASVSAVDSAYGGSGTTLLEAVVVAGTLNPATEADAQACSPGKHLAVWYIKLSLLGEPLDVPIYLSAGAGTSGQSKLDICVPSLPSNDAGSARTLPISSLRLLVSDYDLPKARDLYVWRATVTPLAPDRRTALPQKAYELRAILPQPHVLSLHGRYDRNAHVAVLQGRLSAAGKPRAGARIYFIALDRIIGGDRIIFRDRVAGSVRTTAGGTFTFRKRIRKTTGFLAFVEAATTSCPGTVDPPGGCISSTTAGTQSDPVTVGVPRK